jgi:predicted acyltransferase
VATRDAASSSHFRGGPVSERVPNFDLFTIRILGVLQRIAICYLIAATIFLFCGARERALWTGGILAAYWVLMMAAPTPGCGSGSLERDCNFAKWVDGKLLD